MTLTFSELKGRTARAIAAALLLTACEGKSGETDSATETGPDTTSTGTTSDGPTTGTADTTDTEGTMGGTSTTSPTTGEPGTSTMGGPTTDEATTTSPGTSTTGGPIDEELAESCLAACEKFFACIDNPPFPNVEACVSDCGEAAGEEASCIDAYTAFNSCIAAFDCPEFLDAFINEEFGACNDEFAVIGDACPVCEGFGGQGPDGCSIGKLCSNQPEQEYLCEGDTCTCLVDGQAQGSCPADGFCALEFEAQAAAANECCGFNF